MVEGLCFMSKFSYDRIKTPNSKALFFCEAVFGNCGVFCLHLVWHNLEAYRLAPLVLKPGLDWERINLLPYNKILDRSKLKQIADIFKCI